MSTATMFYGSRVTSLGGRATTDDSDAGVTRLVVDSDEHMHELVIAMCDSVIMVDSGTFHRLTSASLAVGTDWDDRIRAHAAANGMTLAADPQWLLTASSD